MQMEKGDKGSTLIRMGVSGRMFLLVPAYPGCPGSKAVKWSLLLLLLIKCIYTEQAVRLDAAKFFLRNRVLNEWNMFNDKNTARNSLTGFLKKFDRYLSECRDLYTVR